MQITFYNIDIKTMHFSKTNQFVVQLIGLGKAVIIKKLAAFFLDRSSNNCYLLLRLNIHLTRVYYENSVPWSNWIVIFVLAIPCTKCFLFEIEIPLNFSRHFRLWTMLLSKTQMIQVNKMIFSMIPNVFKFKLLLMTFCHLLVVMNRGSLLHRYPLFGFMIDELFELLFFF